MHGLSGEPALCGDANQALFTKSRPRAQVVVTFEASEDAKREEFAGLLDTQPLAGEEIDYYAEDAAPIGPVAIYGEVFITNIVNEGEREPAKGAPPLILIPPPAIRLPLLPPRNAL